jgi:hypothetical protein
MKLPIAIVALLFAATTAVPAFAAMRTPHAVHPRATTGPAAPSGYNANASANGSNAQAPAAQPAVSGWGHCVSGFEGGTSSAYPMWDVCR